MGKTQLDLSQISGLDDLTLEEYLVKIKNNDSKIIVFVIPGELTSGVQKTEIRFPFSGEIEQVYASCSTPGISQSVIEIEKCSQDFIDSVQTVNEWKNILSENIVIESDKRSSKSSSNQAVISTKTVEVDDHFRININQSGGLRDLTVEVKITI